MCNAVLLAPGVPKKHRIELAGATCSSVATKAAVGCKSMGKYLLSPLFKKPHHL